MNRQAIEQLITQYRTDPGIIFQMPNIAIETPCGTALCIAGQVAVNLGYQIIDFKTDADPDDVINPDQAWDIAVEALELSDEDDEDGISEDARLFDKQLWPSQFHDLPDTPALAADRLQHFLDTDGAE